MTTYTIGLDYGTNSVRGLLVDVSKGTERAASVFNYPSGSGGVILDGRDPLVARQNPQDYIDGAEFVIRNVLQQAADVPGFDPAQVVGIGVDTTGSTPLPVDESGTPLALLPDLEGELDALAVLWKDHTAYAEAEAITRLAREIRPHYLAKCGGTYSAEWFWAKILHNLRVNPKVFERSYTWVELADWLPALLSGTTKPSALKRGICAAGHKGLFHADWGGYPDAEFLSRLDPGLVRIRETLPNHAFPIGQLAGHLSPEWATCTGLSIGIPVSIGGFDAHLGAVGAGISAGVLVKIIGTSTCDLMVAPMDVPLPDIPGLCGIVPESVLPGYYGLEAGQSAVGDIFNWYVNSIKPNQLTHEQLTAEAALLAPGESGLLALDWHNGNRTVLVDQRLTGGVIGLTLHTTPAQIYRTWIEATAFGARVIMERLEESGQSVDHIINCGGIAAKNPLAMQIYANVMGKPIHISSNSQTCALGAAIAAAVTAGVFPTFKEATDKLTRTQPEIFQPEPHSQAVYERLYSLYKRLHDAFGIKGANGDLYDVMKQLLALREEVTHD